MGPVKLKRGDTLRMTDLGRCPCGGEIAANLAEGAVAHVEPRCPEFDRLGPLEFLRYVRLSRGLVAPGEA